MEWTYEESDDYAFLWHNESGDQLYIRDRGNRIPLLTHFDDRKRYAIRYRRAHGGRFGLPQTMSYGSFDTWHEAYQEAITLFNISEDDEA